MAYNNGRENRKWLIWKEAEEKILRDVTTFLFNVTMMKMLGEDGVAAITVLIYSQFLLTTLYIGFSMGTAPVVSYNYGSGNVNLKTLQFISSHFKFHRYFYNGSENNKLESGKIRINMLTRRFVFQLYRTNGQKL